MIPIAMMAALLAAGPAASPVTVEIVASGHVETPAQKYRIAASLLACATSQAEADRALADKRAGVERAMAAMNVVTAAPPERFSFGGIMGSMASLRSSIECYPSVPGGMRADPEDAGDHGAKGKPAEKVARKVGADVNLSFDAPDAATATRAIAALKAADAKPSDKAVPVLIDDSAARRAAKQQALAKARTEADDYAHGLGLGRATLTRISERQDLGSVDFIAQMVRTMGLPGTALPDRVATDITLTVEFRLGAGG